MNNNKYFCAALKGAGQRFGKCIDLLPGRELDEGIDITLVSVQ